MTSQLGRVGFDAAPCQCSQHQPLLRVAMAQVITRSHNASFAIQCASLKEGEISSPGPSSIEASCVQLYHLCSWAGVSDLNPTQGTAHTLSTRSHCLLCHIPTLTRSLVDASNESETFHVLCCEIGRRLTALLHACHHAPVRYAEMVTWASPGQAGRVDSLGCPGGMRSAPGLSVH